MDKIDLKILSLLRENGRITLSDLAGLTNLSIPATGERVKKMERSGVITGYSALVNPQAFGYQLMALVFVTLNHPKHILSFKEAVTACREVLECYHLAGDADYFLKVLTRSTSDLEAFLSDTVKRIEGVRKTRTMVVLSTIKEALSPPLIFSPCLKPGDSEVEPRRQYNHL